MKKILFILVAILGLSFTQRAEAKIPIFYGYGEKASVTSELPQEADIDGTHVNFGVVYKQFSLFWVPIWNYGGVEYALISDDEKTYWNVDEDLLSLLKEEYNVEVGTPSIPFWQKVGGKPVILIIIVLIIWSYLPKKKGEKEQGEDENLTSTTTN